MGIDKIVAKVGDLEDGQMVDVEVGDRNILLVRVNGQFHAIGGHCTHYGAPLVKGILNGHHVICPWHHTYFNVLTGDLEEPPGLDGLPGYEVRVVGQDVLVSIPDGRQEHRVMTMAAYDPNADPRTFVVIGGGAAGAVAVETLRQDGYQGRIVLVSRERNIPYDRPHLSKGYMRQKGEPEGPPVLRSLKFYYDHGVKLVTDQRVVKVSVRDKTICLEGGTKMKYDQLLVAPGGIPRHLDVPGAQLQNILLLRSYTDAKNIAAAVERSERIVIVGSSFIGMETAAGFAERGKAVTVVSQDACPFEKTLGDRIGTMFQKLHENRGVVFEMNTSVDEFDGEDKVRAVVLKNGKRIETDLVVVGIGVELPTDFIEGVERNSDGSVSVDRYLRMAPDAYAAGDIARFVDWRTNHHIRVEHWRVAQQHGRCAAHNMAGREVEFRGLPFFWTTQLKLSLRYVGYTDRWDEIIYHGEPADRKFMAYYVRNQQVLAAAGVGHDAKIAAAAELMRENRFPTSDDLRQGNDKLLQQLTAARTQGP